MDLFTFERKTESSTIKPMRTVYLDDLPHAQEYYVELQIQQANIYEINFQLNRIGYVILSSEGCLLEYYVGPEYINQVDLIFGEIIRRFSIKRALCKSFDAVLLSCCFSYHKSSRAIGVLFREYIERPHDSPVAGVTIRRAVPADEIAIVDTNEEVFDHPTEVMKYIQAKQIFLFENNAAMIGFGIYSQVIPGRPDRDIGMLVVPAFRKRGFGQFILHHLIRFCHDNNWRVSAGCAIENTASRRCLEKTGFIGRYRLLEFTF
jgi:GNAT superfamily N-acetyltransferase